MKSAIFLFLLLLPSLLLANELKILRIGVEEIPYLPYYESTNGNYSGFARDLFDQFAKEEGFKFQYIPLPIKRLYNDFLNKDSHLDFKFPDNKYWAQDLKKDRSLYYSEGVVVYTDGTLVTPLKSKRQTIKNLGIVRGFTPWDYLEQIKSGKVQVTENNSIESLLKLAILNRVDGVYVNVDVAKYLLRNNLKQENGLIFDEKFPHSKSSYSLSTLKHPELVKKFDSWLNKNSDFQKKLYNKWKLKREK